MVNNKYTRAAEEEYVEEDEQEQEEQDEEEEAKESPKRKRAAKAVLASEDEEEEQPQEEEEEEGGDDEEERPARTAESIKMRTGETLSYVDDSAEGPKGSGDEEEEEEDDDDVAAFIASEDDDAGNAETEHVRRRKLDAKREAEEDPSPEDDPKVKLFHAMSQRRNQDVTNDFPRPTPPKPLAPGKKKLTPEQELVVAKNHALHREQLARQNMPTDTEDPFATAASTKGESKAGKAKVTKRRAESGDASDGDEGDEEYDEAAAEDSEEEDEGEETKVAKSPTRKPRTREPKATDTRKVQKAQYVPDAKERAQPEAIVAELSQATGKPQVLFKGHYWDLVDMGSKPNPKTYNLRAAPVSIDHPSLLSMVKHDWRRYYAVVKLEVDRPVTSKKKKKPEGANAPPPPMRKCTIFRTFWVAPCGALQWIKDTFSKGAEVEQSLAEQLERAICAMTPGVDWDAWMALVMNENNRGANGWPVVPEQFFVTRLEPRSALRRDNAIPVAHKANKPKAEQVDAAKLAQTKKALGGGFFGAATDAASDDEAPAPSNGVHKPVVKRKAAEAASDTEDAAPAKPAPKPTPAAAVASARAAAQSTAKPLGPVSKPKPPAAAAAASPPAPKKAKADEAGASPPAPKKAKAADTKTPVAKVHKQVEAAVKKRQAVLEDATEQVSPQQRRADAAAREADDAAAKRREDVAERKRAFTLEADLKDEREAAKKRREAAPVEETAPAEPPLSALQRLQLLQHKAATPAASEKKALEAATAESKRLAEEEKKKREEEERKQQERDLAAVKEQEHKEQLEKREREAAAAKALDDEREKKLMAAKLAAQRAEKEEREAKERHDADVKVAKKQVVEAAKARAAEAKAPEKADEKTAAKPVEKPAAKAEPEPLPQGAKKKTVAVVPAERAVLDLTRETAAAAGEPHAATPAFQSLQTYTETLTLRYYMDRMLHTMGVSSVAALYERAPHLVEMMGLTEEEKTRLIPRLNGKAPM